LDTRCGVKKTAKAPSDENAGLVGKALEARSASRQRLRDSERLSGPDEIRSLWRVLAADFERAALDGDSDLLKRQEKGLLGQRRSLAQCARREL
jgi:hypothetical protein